MRKKNNKLTNAKAVKVQRLVGRNTLIRDITLLQRAIFGLRETHKTKGRTQELLDEAREAPHFAKVQAEWDAANGELCHSEQPKTGVFKAP